MQETQVRFLGREALLEEEMATHSSIPAWRLPQTEESGGATVHRGGKESDTTEVTNASADAGQEGRAQGSFRLRKQSFGNTGKDSRVTRRLITPGRTLPVVR